MFYIDTHCHLNDENLFDKRDSLIQRAFDNQVNYIFVVGYDLPSSIKALQIAEEYPQVFALIGIHPTEASKINKVDLDKFESYLSTSKKVIGIGEIGLDYYWQKEEVEHQLQKDLFIYQINLANKYHLPISIHCRDAFEDTLKILQNHPALYQGVMHCYSGPSSMVDDFIQAGMYISFAGPITFKKAFDAREALNKTPLERLLFETDSPYLSPMPFRGKENEPDFVRYVYQKGSEEKKITLPQLQKQIILNVETLFHVKLK